MRVFVTGLTGFLGASVARSLAAQGHEVIALCRSESSAGIAAERGARPAMGDLDDAESFRSALEFSNADAVVHLASMGFGHAETMVAVPKAVGVHRCVFTSTTALFTKLDATSKTVRGAAEDAVFASALGWTVVRPTMIYGRPGDRNIERLVRRVRQVPVFPLPGAKALQQPVHVDDLADSIVCALHRPQAIGEAIDVAGPEALTFRDVVRQTASAAGTKVRLVPLPVTPAVKGLGLLERFPGSLPISSEQVARLNEDKSFDVAKAAALLDHSPRSFADGVELLVQLLDEPES